jgi:hypothetical protein
MTTDDSQAPANKADLHLLRQDLHQETALLRADIRMLVELMQEAHGHLRGEMTSFKEEIRGDFREFKEGIYRDMADFKNHLMEESERHAKELHAHFDMAVEDFRTEAAKMYGPQITQLQDTDRKHNRRIHRLEKHAGFLAA